MQAIKAKFLLATKVATEDDAARNCVSAAFKRNKIYLKGWENTSQSDKDKLYFSLVGELHRLSQTYIAGPVNEIDHERNILNLADDLSRKHGAIPSRGRFNIGTSQKALNLYLKFLWYLDCLPVEPVHCPVDSIILSKASIFGISWTQIDDIQTYRLCIGKIRKAARLQSLSAWELDEWNRSQGLVDA